MTTTTDGLKSLAHTAPVLSVLPNLRLIPLHEMPSAKAALSETLNRVLPTPEIQQVPVAAFNSSI
jgi:FXSXX-COOH protein